MDAKLRQQCGVVCLCFVDFDPMWKRMPTLLCGEAPGVHKMLMKMVEANDECRACYACCF